ncbi:hypothetical protein N8J89_39525 [Crossiella sp. CA-258035]|uniref:hypothetical protein n=1 Tax=Crossiella sp. CA-258035 TaxID=2981138 RepID=UPI0024BC7C0F|nr:hypothetical protein [Crossiella sp. CA-258035]WHT19117.1 hypothetical protein N8J89_39525 [Crossiella sp. CA-258035]
MTSAGAVRSRGERLRVVAVRLAIASGLAAAAWLAGAVAAHADESPARADVLSPSTVSEVQEPAKTDAVARAGGLGARITERVTARLDRPGTALRGTATPLTSHDEADASGGGMVAVGSDEVRPLPEQDGPAPAPIRSTRTAKSAEGSVSAVRPPRQAPPPPPPPVQQPAPVEPVVEPVVVETPPAAPVLSSRPMVTVRTVEPKAAEPPAGTRPKQDDGPDLPMPDPRKPAPSAPSSASLGGTASDNGGARGATALVTAPLPQLPKPSLVTVEHPRNAGSPSNTPGLPPTSPD